LDEAVDYCKKHGIEFYAVNRSYPEEEFDSGEMSRKLDVDLFIDDRNIGGFPGWSEIWQILNPDTIDSEYNELSSLLNKGNRSMGSRLKNLFK
jgi:hypothetical protein